MAGLIGFANLSSPGVAAAAAPFDQAATTIDELLARGRPIVLAHNGGETEFPGGTLYAFARSMEAGVDVLDLNVQLSADGVVVVHHDLDVERTTNGSGLVAEMTFDELHALDAAYWFTEECGVCADQPDAAYLYRGARSGGAAPGGFTPDDFAISRLEDVLDRHPDIPLSIEIKSNGDQARAIADALVDLLRDRDRLDSVVISSFEDAIVDYVHELAPNVDVTSLSTSIFYLLDGRPMPDFTRIVQPSAYFEDRPVVTAETVATAHDAGYAVWLWPNNHELENDDAYAEFLALGVDGLNIDFPATAVSVVERLATTTAAG